MGATRWGQWKSNFLTRLNDIGGLMTVALSVAGVGIGVVSVYSAALAAVAGGLLGLGAAAFLLWEWYRARPLLLTAEQVRDRQLTLDAINHLPPGCVFVALVGVGSAGKTTLRDHLCNRSPARIHTSAPELIVLNAGAAGLIGFLDAAGEDHTQQFEIVDHADCVVLLLDHNSGSTASRPLASRRGEQDYLVDQFLFKLARRGASGKPIRSVHLLRNKHDLWTLAATADRGRLRAWFDAVIARIQKALPGVPVTADDHSNQRTDDIVRIRERLFEMVRGASAR